MCGFPLLHLDKHLKVLVQKNKRFVAMCEEFPRHSAMGTKEFERRVVRVVTPGTLIDEPFLNPYENNYLLAISAPERVELTDTARTLGLAWIDVSTGEFFSKLSTFDNLRDELTRINPREVVLDKKIKLINAHPVFHALAEEENFITYTSPVSPKTGEGLRPTRKELSEDLQPHINSPLDCNISEASAIDLLTHYLNVNLLDHMPHLSSPKREGIEPRMEIDSHTIKALEIRERIREGGIKGSLLSVIKRTLTSGGTRLLARWLCRSYSLNADSAANLRFKVHRVLRSLKSRLDSL
jgi:DNA mismatch repair ATPase MutS